MGDNMSKTATISKKNSKAAGSGDGMSVDASWNAEQNKFLFTAGTNGKMVAASELEMTFDGCDYASELKADPDGNVRLSNENIEVCIVNKPDHKRGILRQIIRIRAKKEGVLRCRYVVTLPVQKNDKIFVPVFWSYLGVPDKLAVIDTHYPSYGLCNQVKVAETVAAGSEGGKFQLRTPAVCAEQGQGNVTVASLGPHPTHIVIEQCTGGLRFIVCLDRTGIGPDGYEANPRLAAGEELTTQIYIASSPGDWQTGMQRWMRYNMATVVKDNGRPPEWTKHVRMFWCKWDKISKSDINIMAELGVELLEVHPFTEPDPELITYAHKKGLKILLEHYLLSYYESAHLTRLDLSPGVDDPHISSACLAAAAEHPEWCVLKQDGKVWGISETGAAYLNMNPNVKLFRQAKIEEAVKGWTYIHMDPNVKEFRQAKIEEAVAAVQKGYDGIRYDNAIHLNCFSKNHQHTMTYEHAVSTLLKEIKQAIRKVNPEAVIFINNGGPDLYSVADMHMYEGGLSDEIELRKRNDGDSQKGSSYMGASNRLMNAKVLWQFAGKRYCIHDYPVHTKEGAPAFWRSAIFTVMHDGICSFGGAIECTEGSRLPEYRIASTLLANIKAPLTEIVYDQNIAYRLYAPGSLLVMETEGKTWSGIIKGLNLPIEMEREYNLFSLVNNKFYYSGKGKDFLSGIKFKIVADGSDVLQLLET